MKSRPKQPEQGRVPSGHSQGLQVRADEVKVVEEPVIKIKLRCTRAVKVKVRQWRILTQTQTAMNSSQQMFFYARLGTRR